MRIDQYLINCYGILVSLQICIKVNTNERKLCDLASYRE